MNLKRIITEVFNPRFSTEEIENSKLKRGFNFDVTSMIYEDERPHFPTHVLGFVKTKQGHSIECIWNKHGKCTHQGNRVKSFDLIRPTRQKIDSSRTVGSLFIVGFFMILILIIFN